MDLHLALIGERPQRLDVRGAERLLGEVDLSRLQPNQLRVLIRNDLDGEAVSVRQLHPARIPPPVVRVPLEDHAARPAGTAP